MTATAARTHILVVDDEPDLRALLQDYLGLQGFAVRAAEDVPGLEAAIAEETPDLIVLDVNMPGESGAQALARLRRSGLGAGVILLTAAGELGDRISGLVEGADDYVVKPFEPRELLARIRAVLRRMPDPSAAPPAAEPLLRMGRVRFDPGRRCLVEADGQEVELTAMEFDLLEVLVRHPRQVLSRERLAVLAHGRSLAPGDRSIDIRIRRLRQKLEPDPSRPATLRTVHGEGYVFDPGT